MVAKIKASDLPKMSSLPSTEGTGDDLVRVGRTNLNRVGMSGLGNAARRKAVINQALAGAVSSVAAKPREAIDKTHVPGFEMGGLARTMRSAFGDSVKNDKAQDMLTLKSGVRQYDDPIMLAKGGMVRKTVKVAPIVSGALSMAPPEPNMPQMYGNSARKRVR